MRKVISQLSLTVQPIAEKSDLRSGLLLCQVGFKLRWLIFARAVRDNDAMDSKRRPL